MSISRSGFISEEFFKSSVKYLSRIDKESTQKGGSVQNCHGVIYQRYRDRPLSDCSQCQSAPSEFVVSNTDSETEFIFRKESRRRSVFRILHGNTLVGSVQKIGIFRNLYLVSIDGFGQWSFKMPLFSTHYLGSSNCMQGFRVIVGPSKKEWNIFVDPKVDRPVLIASIAFIHSEHWNHG